MLDRFAARRVRAALVPVFAFAFSVTAPPLAAAETTAPPCKPCLGIAVADPAAVVPALAAPPRLADDARLYVAWDVPLDGTATPATAAAVAAAGGTPWLRLRFRTPAPVLEHLQELQAELDAATTLLRSCPVCRHAEIDWEGDAGDADAAASAREYGFLFKRAAVAVAGANAAARVLARPTPPSAEALEAFYEQEVAAYVDGVPFPAGDDAALDAAFARLAELDPGRAAIVTAAPWPADSRLALAEAARRSAAGAAMTIFDAPATLDAAALAPLKVLANEFRGDLSLDPYSKPEGGAAAWSFVRGEDLGLRVLATPPADANEVTLRFADPQLRAPVAVNLATGESVPLGGGRAGEPLTVALRKTGPVVLLRLERVAAEEIDGGVAEKVTVAGERQIPVEEILRRLQAFEDAQARRLDHYQGVNTTKLRFQAASGVSAIEATFEGSFFARDGQATDWAWQKFYINGIEWRGKEIPDLPLIQPEKAAAMPLEILFTREYRYSLRGTENVAGRDCWVVDFAPAVPVEGKALYQGTVWIDRETSARVRSRALQLGLEGEVLSNEETVEYSPVDAGGAAAPWSGDAFVLPLHVSAQQILSIVNTATVVEKDVRLGALVLNGERFDEARRELLESDATMLRDTAKGLRYLVKDEATGERVVREDFDTGKLFAIGGLFYDDSFDYPLPLVGLNYFDLDFRGHGRQLNAFFGGVLGILNYADPRLFGSRFDAGVDAFAIAIASNDQLFRGEIESPGEDVEERPARVTLNLGYPLGAHGKATATYQLGYEHYGRSDDTDDSFVVPQSTLTHRFGLELAFARSGYRLSLSGQQTRRADWEFWGLPGNLEFDPDQRDFTTWQASASKNWYFKGFQKLGMEVDYSGGRNLDRFSKYQFGFFGGNRVHGYQIGKVRAEEAWAAHVSYGFEIGKLFRLDGVFDAAWATDEVAGLDDEFLGGVGLSGTLIGPWETLVNIDIGTPVAGPDDGIVAYIVFLKLFK